MLYDANKKSPVVAYLLLIFLGGLGAHRFYVKRHGTATLMLILNLLGWAFLGAGGEIAVLPLVVVGVWLVIDLFLTRGLVRSFNHDLIRRFDSP
jgi:TM2 domain-containing membrane protein YozV